MPGVPLPKPISVAQFVPDPNEPTFTQIFTDTMGNLGSPADGFDDAFNDLVAMQPPNGGQDAVMGPAGLQLSQVRDAIATGSLRTLLPGLQSAITAGNGKFNTVALDVAPANQTQPPVTPPTTNPPETAPSCDPASTGDTATVIPDMTVGGAPYVLQIDAQQYGAGGGPLTIKGNVWCGDLAIFSAQKVVNGVGYYGGAPAYEAILSFVVTPAKAGTFTGAYREYDSSLDLYTFTWLTVTIHPAPTAGEGGQPLPTQP